MRIQYSALFSCSSSFFFFDICRIACLFSLPPSFFFSFPFFVRRERDRANVNEQNGKLYLFSFLFFFVVFELIAINGSAKTYSPCCFPFSFPLFLFLLNFWMVVFPFFFCFLSFFFFVLWYVSEYSWGGENRESCFFFVPFNWHRGIKALSFSLCAHLPFHEWISSHASTFVSTFAVLEYNCHQRSHVLLASFPILVFLFGFHRPVCWPSCH